MGRRTIAILIFVVGILMLAVVGVIFILQQDQPQPPVETVEEGTPVAGTPTGEEEEPGVAPPTGVDLEGTVPAMVEVVVSLQTVPRGFQITEEELTTDMRLADEVASNAITDIEDAVGLYARNDIFQGETLTEDALADDPTLIGVENYSPSSLIPQGFVAAAVPMDRLNSVAYALDEGDYIDIMITFYFYQIDEEFQTYLENAAIFFLEEAIEVSEEIAAGEVTEEEVTTIPEPFIIFPFGRFEELPTGDLAHVGPSEFQRPVPVAMILQNARVIQVGPFTPPSAAQLPTATPEPVEEGEPTPTPSVATPTPEPPDVLLVALSPQQQLFLKYAVESKADIDFALRGVNDGQLYAVDNVDLNYLLEQFDIEVPPNFSYSVDAVTIDVTVTPIPESEGTVPEGG